MANPVDLRVVNAHRQAVEGFIAGMTGTYQQDKEGFHQGMAEAVLTATDSSTRYAVLVRDGTGLLAFGPYASTKAAQTVALTCLPVREGSKYTIVPLIPAPRKEKR